MKKTGRVFAINLLLILVIVILLGVGYVWFIAGPSRAYDKQDELYVLEFLEGEDYDEARMVSRFSFDTVYYILEVKEDDFPSLVWFDHTFERSGVHDNVGFEPVFELADKYGVDRESISFGVYEDKLVYVLRRQDMFEIFVSVDTLEIVLHIGGVY